MTNQIKGIDVSHWQNGLDWTVLKSKGWIFAFVKATEGIHFLDPCFIKNWTNARKANFQLGAYHFYTNDTDPQKQANFFIKNIRPFYHNADLPPVLDFENGSIKIPSKAKAIGGQLLVWLQTVEQALQQKPIIYTNTSTANQYLTDPSFKQYPLWIASYQKDKPTIPDTWKEVGYTFWQYGQENLQGLSVDVNLFNGTLFALKNLEICNQQDPLEASNATKSGVELDSAAEKKIQSLVKAISHPNLIKSVEALFSRNANSEINEKEPTNPTIQEKRPQEISISLEGKKLLDELFSENLTNEAEQENIPASKEKVAQLLKILQQATPQQLLKALFQEEGTLTKSEATPNEKVVILTNTLAKLRLGKFLEELFPEKLVAQTGDEDAEKSTKKVRILAKIHQLIQPEQLLKELFPEDRVRKEETSPSKKLGFLARILQKIKKLFSRKEKILPAPDLNQADSLESTEASPETLLKGKLVHLLEGLFIEKPRSGYYTPNKKIAQLAEELIQGKQAQLLTKLLQQKMDASGTRKGQSPPIPGAQLQELLDERNAFEA